MKYRANHHPERLIDVAALRTQQTRWSRAAFRMARNAVSVLDHASWRLRLPVMLQVTGYMFPILLLSLVLSAGAAAWARGSQVWNGQTGTLMAKAIFPTVGKAQHS